MRIVRPVSTMQKLAKSWRSEGTRVALIPTMGYLHAGHLSLVKRARKLVDPKGKVVVSIYVNPTQFGPKEDFSRYPRDLRRDSELCRSAGVDILFAPADREMYAPSYGTYVVEESLTSGMEGASRPTHFRGVTTIVAKLFNLALPDFAVFGAKDFQQATVITRMVRDLNFPLKIIVAPTFREPDGLAMSSRNKYLTGSLRTQALVLSQSLSRIRAEVRKSAHPLPADGLKAKVKKWIEAEPDARLDYVEFFDPATLSPVLRVERGAQMALAVFVGSTRLIDNARL